MAVAKSPGIVEVELDSGEKQVVNLHKKSKLNRREKTGYFFVIPYIVAFCIFSIYPVYRTLWLSFQNIDIKIVSGTTYTFVGFEKYMTVLKDSIFWQCLLNTVKIWGINIVLQLGLAFLLTIIFVDVKYKIRGLSVYRAVYYLPNIIAATSLAFLFQTLLDAHYGTFNKMISAISGIHVTIDWLNDPKYTFAVIGIIQAWMWFGNSFIMLMAGVMGISRDYYEASAIDGAGRWKQFTKITLPLLKPIMLYVGVTSLIGGLQMFDLPQLMIARTSSSWSSIRTVIMYLYDFGFGVANDGGRATSRAAATAYILFVIILVFSVLQFVFMRDKEE